MTINNHIVLQNFFVVLLISYLDKWLVTTKCSQTYSCTAFQKPWSSLLLRVSTHLRMGNEWSTSNPTHWGHLQRFNVLRHAHTLHHIRFMTLSLHLLIWEIKRQMTMAGNVPRQTWKEKKRSHHGGKMQLSHKERHTYKHAQFLE